MISTLSFGQKITEENWTKKEKQQYKNLIQLADYVKNKNKSEISKSTLFKKYIYFDYVLSDTNIERKEKRLAQFDTLFYDFRKTINTIGLENLDAKPIRFYKKHKIYKPFDKKQTTLKTVGGEKMYTKDANVFVYFKKEEPENPLGCLLFDAEKNKLVSWVMLNQGGYHYFLTFNLL